MINGEIIVDNFAGGGGASTGIEMATGRSVDIAINHDREAIRMHKTNHPYTKHYCEDVWMVDPIEACNGRKVGLAWFSPDCKHFSKAKGGKPKSKKIRGLAWVACRWAALVRPRVIMLENVEEFRTWGPLNRSHRPIKKKQGVTFQKFVTQLENLGYEVQFRELVAADYGAPTTRKRFFMIARCDGKPIVWPEPTHAPRNSEQVKQGLLKPYVPASACIDFTLPCPSIFDTSEEIKEKFGVRAVRPLAEKTLNRIARGLKKFVLDNPEPFIIQICQTGWCHDRSSSIHEPIKTVVTKNEHCLIQPTLAPYMGVNTTNHIGGKCSDPIHTLTTGNQQCLIMPSLIQYHSETTKDGARGQTVRDALNTVDGSNRYGLVSAFIQKYYGGNYNGNGSELEEPLHTITSLDHNSLVNVSMIEASTLIQMNKGCFGRDIKEPLPTVVSGDGHFGEVRAFLIKYYGNSTSENLNEPLDTITAKDRFGLVKIKGVDYKIVDIGLRMLEPRELYNAQGFPSDYIINRDYTGATYSRSEQVKRCGNAVPPPFARALVKANLPEMCVGERMPNMQLKQEESGQIRMFA